MGMGLVVAGGLAMMKVSENQNQSSLRVQNTDEVNFAVYEAKSFFENQRNCQSKFKGASTLEMIKKRVNTGLNLPLIRPTLKTSYGKTIQKIDYKLGKHSAWPSGDGEFSFNITLDIQRKNGLPNISQTIEPPIYLELKNSVVKTCLTPMERQLREMQKKICENVGGSYTGATKPWCKLENSAKITQQANTPYLERLKTGLVLDGVAISTEYMNEHLPNHYLRPSSPTTQEVYGNLTFQEGLSESVILKKLPASPGASYYGKVSPDYSDKMAFTSSWWRDNFKKVLDYVGGFYCTFSGGMVILTNSGPKCTSPNDLTCHREGSYLKGIDERGNPICRDLLGEGSPCHCGGELKVKNDGKIYYDCLSCGSSSNGSWVLSNPLERYCENGILYDLYHCRRNGKVAQCNGGPPKIARGSCSEIPPIKYKWKPSGGGICRVVEGLGGARKCYNHRAYKCYHGETETFSWRDCYNTAGLSRPEGTLLDNCLGDQGNYSCSTATEAVFATELDNCGSCGSQEQTYRWKLLSGGSCDRKPRSSGDYICTRMTMWACMKTDSEQVPISHCLDGPVDGPSPIGHIEECGGRDSTGSCSSNMLAVYAERIQGCSESYCSINTGPDTVIVTPSTWVKSRSGVCVDHFNGTCSRSTVYHCHTNGIRSNISNCFGRDVGYRSIRIRPNSKEAETWGNFCKSPTDNCAVFLRENADCGTEVCLDPR